MAGRGPGAEGATAVAKSKAKKTWYPTAPCQSSDYQLTALNSDRDGEGTDQVSTL